MKSRTLSGMKPIKPQNVNLILSTAHRPANITRHVYTACTSRLCLYIYRGKENHEKKHDRYNMERLGTNVREIEKYETTLKRVVLTTDKKLLYQAEYNRKIRAAQRQQ